MPIRTVFILDKSAADDKLAQLAIVGAAAAVDAFADESKSAAGTGGVPRPGGEVIVRELFNSGASNLYYAYGRTCDVASGNYLAYIVPGQMLEVPVLERVSVYAAGNTTVNRTSIRIFQNEVPATTFLS